MTEPAPTDAQLESGFLSGIRVLEVADELGEYCGKILAGVGADVVKVEPPGGERTRTYGPFHRDRRGPERSLYFWHYNFGKRGITLDLDTPDGIESFKALAADADVLLDTRPRGHLDERGLGWERLEALNPRLVYARISPFGDSGPWADYKACDLVHLALGGVMLNCGYDPEPSGYYSTPPIAPQMWHAYHITGELTAIAILAALCHRQDSGRGQMLSASVHAAVSLNTEMDVPDWIYTRSERHRLTCRHSAPDQTPFAIAKTNDGRWMLPSLIYATAPGRFEALVGLLDRHGMAGDLTEERYGDAAYRELPSVREHIVEIIAVFVQQFPYARDIWRDGQEAGLLWAPERKPEENLNDEHWSRREAFFKVTHPELNAAFNYVGAKWMSPDVPWRKGPRAPLVGEHNAAILSESRTSRLSVKPLNQPARAVTSSKSKLGKPFALSGVRVIDLTWQVASAGAGRFLAAHGAEVIKVEHRSRWDTLRFDHCDVPPGLREQRRLAKEPIVTRQHESPNRGGIFMDVNAGKRSIGLNLQHARGKELLADLIRTADVVTDGFTPTTLSRLGFGYDRLREINPGIVYAQQSGLGEIGIYGRMRTAGPLAAAFSGLSEMSGLPEPCPPAGWGYSYLDWIGAYNLALAVLAGLYRKRATGQGCWIDSSQVEAGTYITGTAILDYSANRRPWRRYGNRSPNRKAAPHGAYRVAGDDRWIAIACFSDLEWSALLSVLRNPAWAQSPEFGSLDSRLANQDELDRLVESSTRACEGFSLMASLQAAGVPAGMCQTAEERVDDDPQLRHLGWLTELRQTEIGTWPVRGFPVQFSETPSYAGGPINRHGPNYAEDNEYVYGQIVGLTSSEIAELDREGVI